MPRGGDCWPRPSCRLSNTGLTLVWGHSQLLEMHTRANSSGVQTLQARPLLAEARLLRHCSKQMSPQLV